MCWFCLLFAQKYWIWGAKQLILPDFAQIGNFKMWEYSAYWCIFKLLRWVKADKMNQYFVTAALLSSKSPLFRYNCSKNCCLASAKTAVFSFILTKNRLILSALQFLLSYFIRISEKKFFAYFPYSRDFLSLRRMKEQRKNLSLFIEGAPKR